MFLIVLLLFFVNTITSVLPCNNLQIELSYIRNCAGVNSLIKLSNVNLTLDNDCYLIPKGLRTIVKDYNTAQATLFFEGPNAQKIKTNMNLCKPIGANPFALKIFNLFSVPFECPVKKGKQKLENKQDLNILRKTGTMFVGQSHLKGIVQHDNGVTCLEGSYNLRKK